MSIVQRIVIGWCLCAVILLARPAWAAIPGAQDPNVYTTRQFVQELHAYNTETLVGAYQAHGRTNPTWDAAATEFLQAMAVRFTNAGKTWKFRLPDEKGLLELKAMAEALEAQGCDDPLVQYCHVVILSDGQMIADVRPRLQMALKGLVDQQGPPARIAFAAKRLRDQYDPKTQADAYTQADTIFRDNLTKVLHGDALDTPHARIMWDLFGNAMEAYPLDVREAFLNKLKASSADPWWINVALGTYHVDKAWDFRGGGWAKHVTADGWRGFHQHLDLARDCFTAAWNLAPDRPEPAAEMCWLAYADGEFLKEHPRIWFNRAVTAQFDYGRAYEVMFSGLLPRWGGSHRAMYAFGLECLNTNRFDTDVPFQFISALTRIADDTEGDYTFHRTEARYEHLKRFVDGELEQSPDKKVLLLSYQAAFGWRMGAYEQTRQVLEQMADGFDAYPFERANALPSRVILETYAFTSPSARDIRAAEGQVARGQYKLASQAYEKIRSAMPADDRGRPLIETRLAELQARQTLAGGGNVSIQPQTDMNRWAPLHGTWSIDEGGLIGTASPDGLSIMLCDSPGPRYVLAGTIEFPQTEAGRAASASVTFGFSRPGTFHRLFISPQDQNAVLIDGRSYRIMKDLAIGHSVDFEVWIWDDRVAVRVDGDKTFSFTTYAHSPTALIGLGAIGEEGTQVRFSHLRLNAHPAPAK